MYSLSDFDYSLPSELIAQSPFDPRDLARLLHVTHDNLNDYVMRDLPSLLRPGDLLLANDTKVIPAQLHGRINGKNIGLTLHKQISEDSWLAFAKPAKKCVLNWFGDLPKKLVKEQHSYNPKGQLQEFFHETSQMDKIQYRISKEEGPPHNKIFEIDPFISIDDGVGDLIEIATLKGKKQNKNIKLGICGEHGGDPKSIRFCSRTGLNYVSCSPYRVPVARLAAAQAELVKNK